MLRRLRSGFTAIRIIAQTDLPNWSKKFQVFKCLSRLEFLRIKLIEDFDLKTEIQMGSVLAIVEVLVNEQKNPSFYMDDFFGYTDKENDYTDRWIDSSHILNIIIKSWVKFHEAKMSEDQLLYFEFRQFLLENLSFYSFLFDSRIRYLNYFIQNYFTYDEVRDFNLLPIPTIEFASKVNPYKNPHKDEYLLNNMTYCNSKKIESNKLTLNECNMIINLLKLHFQYRGISDFSQLSLGEFVEN
jgi:hypothetical protein